MTRPEIRVDRAADDDRFLATDQLVWFQESPSVSTAEQLAPVPADQRFAVDVPDADPASYAGIYGVSPLQLAVPDAITGHARLVQCAGLTWVGVHPDHRRQGILTAMLRHHVEQTHRAGFALSALHASEPGIYERHGYGVSSQTYGMTLGRRTELRATALDAAAQGVRTQFATATDAGIAKRVHECELRAAVTAPGVVVGEEDFYSYIVQSSQWPELRRDKEPMRFLFAVRDGEDVGLAAFRRHHKWEDSRPQGKLEVFNISGDPATRLALLRRLLDFDLMSNLTLPRVGTDDPIWSWIGPRAADKVEVHENLWIRIIDLPAALPLRAYANDCHVVVDIVDPAAPWHAGRWRIHVREGAASAERTDDPADVTLPIAALGAAYLGGTNLVALHHAGLLDEHRPGAIAKLWRAFRTDLAPSPAIGF